MRDYTRKRFLYCSQTGLAQTSHSYDERFEISPVNREILRSALRLETKDFEDAVQIASAEAEGIDFIVTRDTADYAKSPVKALTPTEFVRMLT